MHKNKPISLQAFNIATAGLLAARRYATFWNNGDERFARTAIPDLRADMRQMIVAGDRVTVHYRSRTS